MGSFLFWKILHCKLPINRVKNENENLTQCPVKPYIRATLFLFYLAIKARIHQPTTSYFLIETNTYVLNICAIARLLGPRAIPNKTSVFQQMFNLRGLEPQLIKLEFIIYLPKLKVHAIEIKII